MLVTVTVDCLFVQVLFLLLHGIILENASLFFFLFFSFCFLFSFFKSKAIVGFVNCIKLAPK